MGNVASDRAFRVARGSCAPVAGGFELICGCMFSGKTTALIHRLEQAADQGAEVVAFTHAVDDRYRGNQLVTHGGLSFAAVATANAEQIVALAGAADVVGIDEVQFFDASLTEACRHLIASGKYVFAAGLDRTCFGDPFEPVPALVRLATHVQRLRAQCAACGAPAEYTQRLAADIDPIEAQATDPSLVGDASMYEPRCASCFHPVRAQPRNGATVVSQGREPLDQNPTD